MDSDPSLRCSDTGDGYYPLSNLSDSLTLAGLIVGPDDLAATLVRIQRSARVESTGPGCGWRTTVCRRSPRIVNQQHPTQKKDTPSPVSRSLSIAWSALIVCVSSAFPPPWVSGEEQRVRERGRGIVINLSFLFILLHNAWPFTAQQLDANAHIVLLFVVSSSCATWRHSIFLPQPIQGFVFSRCGKQNDWKQKRFFF